MILLIYLAKYQNLAAITEYIPRIISQIETLHTIIASAATNATPILLNDIMLWFAFDSMGEFAFDQSFNMLKNGTWHRLVIQQRSALALLGSLGHTVWAIRIAFVFFSRFWRIRDWINMISFCDRQIERRLAIQLTSLAPTPVDVSGYFIKEYEAGKTAENERAKWSLLSGNAVSVIIGGRYSFFLSIILFFIF